ncbi:MAG: DedA family protein [Betaproteobacteria bacterium]|nr:DedA family protein [Betaproteobacteria bacterium]
MVGTLIDIVLNLDRHLQWLVSNYGVWIYAILFLVIFCETGFVVTPFLPGDSLLFVAGTIAAAGGMYIHALFAVLAVASFSGDNTNYWIGRFIGPRVFTRDKSWAFNPAYLERTRRFYEKHGGKTVTIARFVPIVRTFAPFVAGIGRMSYGRFVFYSFAGSVLWISSLTYAGYYFGSIPVVRRNLTLAIVIIVLLSVTPGIIEYLRHRRRRRAVDVVGGESR